jgi:hypothetical protein
METITLPAKRSRIPGVPKWEAVEQFLARCSRRRDKAMLALMVYGGLRRTEVVRLCSTSRRSGWRHCSCARSSNAIPRLAADGLAILLVEQNARMALACAAEGYVLQTGRVVLRGRAADLAADPAVQRAYLGAS